MADVKFYLEKRKDKETGKPITENVQINLFFSFGSGRLQYYTGTRTDQRNWDAEAMRAKKNTEGATEINRRLSQLQAQVESIYEKALALGDELSEEYLKERIKTPNKAGKLKKTFAEVYDLYLASSKLNKKETTMSNIGSSFNVIKEFSKQEHIKLEFRNIDQEFYDKFLSWCFYKRKINNNAVGTHIRQLKAFLNWATDMEYNTNLSFRKKSFKKLTEEPEIVFLTFEELIHLYNCSFEDKKLADVRDVFCFGCFTGMRHSDIYKLSPEHIMKDRIVFRTKKTMEGNNVPLNSYSKAILNKHKDKYATCLPVLKSSATNELLKDMAEAAKLKRKIELIHFRGSQEIRSVQPLHKILSFHMSKKTFMTNFLAKGGTLVTAMAITGNKDMRSAKRYYKVVDKVKKDEMKKVFG